MRNPKRIPRVMSLLQEIWSKQPDTRFNQLIQNLQTEFNESRGMIYSKELWSRDVYKNDIVAYQRTSELDLFNVEDELFLEFLEMKLEQYERGE